MLYAVLECSDPDCDAAYEGWGEAAELESLACEVCRAPLEIIAFANADRDGVVPRRTELQQRRAA